MRVACICVLYFTAAIAAADTIHLKNGHTIVVGQVQEKDGRIEYQTAEGSYSIPKSIVERVERDTDPRENHDASTDDAAFRALGAAIGRWEAEATFVNAPNYRVKSTLECHWVPQTNSLTCNTVIAGGERITTLVYSYDKKAGKYLCTTSDSNGDVGAGTGEIEGHTWIFSRSVEVGGQQRLLRTTLEFPAPDRLLSKYESSDDGGVHWKIVYTGTALKLAH